VFAELDVAHSEGNRNQLIATILVNIWSRSRVPRPRELSGRRLSRTGAPSGVSALHRGQVMRHPSDDPERDARHFSLPAPG